MNPKMLAAFVDGTKTMVEMATVANAIGFVPDVPGMHGPAETDPSSIPTGPCTRHLEPGKLPEGPTGKVTGSLGRVDTLPLRENLVFLNPTVAGYAMMPSRTVDQDLDEVRLPGGGA